MREFYLIGSIGILSVVVTFLLHNFLRYRNSDGLGAMRALWIASKASLLVHSILIYHGILIGNFFFVSIICSSVIVIYGYVRK